MKAPTKQGNRKLGIYRTKFHPIWICPPLFSDLRNRRGVTCVVSRAESDRMEESTRKVSVAVISVGVLIGLWKLSQAVKNYVASKIAETPMPEASVEDVDFQRVSMEGVEYLAKVSVSNPYPTSLPICEISYSLKSDGREIASGVIPDPGSLKAKDSTMVDVPVKVAHSLLMSLGRDVCKDWDIDYKLDLVFIIDLPVIGNIKIPVSQQGEIKLPTLSDWFA